MEKIIKIYDKYKLYIYIVVIFILVIISFIYLYFKIDNKKVVIDTKNDDTLISQKKEEEVIEEYYYVDIKGQVINPGVYKANTNSIVDDIIKLAGGLKKEADISLINLSKKIKDEMVIIIFSKEEVKSFKKDEEKIVTVIEKCECKDTIVNDACIDKDNTNILIPDKEEAVSTGKVSINRATKEELMSLTGIGESKAEDIILYRNTKGLFVKIEDIMNVSGIGEVLFAKIKENITV